MSRAALTEVLFEKGVPGGVISEVMKSAYLLEDLARDQGFGIIRIRPNPKGWFDVLFMDGPPDHSKPPKFTISRLGASRWRISVHVENRSAS